MEIWSVDKKKTDDRIFLGKNLIMRDFQDYREKQFSRDLSEKKRYVTGVSVERK